MSAALYARVAIDAPVLADGDGGDLYDYGMTDVQATPGQLVLVPFGRRAVVGLVVATATETAIAADRIRDVVAVVADVTALSADWLALTRFAALYYHRPLGEVVLPALPTTLRRATAYVRDDAGAATLPAFGRATRRAAKATADEAPRSDAVALSPMQEQAVDAIRAAAAEATPKPILLYGITGSGKTEVYLHAVAEAVARGRQALVLVPEINLTPQLLQAVRKRLPHARIASLHSGHAAGHRLHQWKLAHDGEIDVLLGTRLAALASLPRLGLVVVDEEHDASYKQHEGLRYSARDLAVMRARIGVDGRSFPVVLASATPSMETWAHAQSGRYQRLELRERAVRDATLPAIRLVPTLRAEVLHGFTKTIRDAIADRLARHEPILVFHNRRGYAPVIGCGACGWSSVCERCSVHAVYHKADGRLHCHHCGWQQRVPRVCPQCGNADLSAVGRGTQRIEESLREIFPDARVARIDRDSTRRKGAAASLLEGVHSGAIDILVGTQMLAKGHDFRNVTLVCVLDADAALFSPDFRAGERLFANLMQVAGRAGRGGERSGHAEVFVQTRAPEHPLFAALVAHDFDRFAQSQLDERRAAMLPPYAYQAVLRAEAAQSVDALAFLAQARGIGAGLLEEANVGDRVALFDPVPMAIARVANVERVQLLVEGSDRMALHVFLARWLSALRALRTRVRWLLEVDPVDL